MIGLATVLALAAPASVRADGGLVPQDPLLIPRQPFTEPTTWSHPVAYRLVHPWCYAHHLSDLNCGSLTADGRFIFSGCRIVRKEPCDDQKPPVLLPDGTPLRLPSANGAGNGAGKGGCPSCRW
jgi:hypothetical protein